jgi:Ran GTPase-activating protein (RanGAP) involved in mRNA processing and transport
VGFDNEIINDDTSNYYKLSIPQAYIELQTPNEDISFKAGHFYTLIGYEVVTAPDNFFYSHSYSMQYAEPFTHWGALANININDKLTSTMGVVRGWDNLSDSNDGNISFLGGLTYAISDDTTTVFSIISGNEAEHINQTM